MWSFYWLDVNSGASSKIASKSSEVINDNAAFLIQAARPLHRRYDSATSKMFEVINWSGIIMWAKMLSYQYKRSVKQYQA